VLALTAGGLAHGWALRWTGDDAYISFRYARNLVEGQGLVFNPGERVEGFTNLLWTLWCAVGLALRVEPEAWANAWSLACHGAIVLVLGEVWRGRGAVGLPVGALLWAVSPDCAAWATSGLETALFSLLLLLGALSVPRPERSGAILALAALTRPDGLLPAAVIGAFTVRGSPWRFAAAFLAIWGPVTAGRVAWFGDFWPNTYYAKSGELSWWDQGFAYLGLYLGHNPILALVPLCLPIAPLPALAALLYATWVAKVGGDFMYGRMLMPATTLGLLALDRAAWHAPRLAGALAAAAGALSFLGPPALAPMELRRGIIDERSYYSPAMVSIIAEDTATIRRFTDGLPLTVALWGGQARMAWLARFPVAIEALAGLTDAYTAHQPLTERGRVGHEKHSPLPYLILDRHADITFSPVMPKEIGLNDYIPRVKVDLGGVEARLLHWDFALADALKARGAKIDNYPRMLAEAAAELPNAPDPCDVWARHWRFYFAHTSDPEREAPFRAACGRAPPFR
jgi:hypothetical protein